MKLEKLMIWWHHRWTRKERWFVNSSTICSWLIQWLQGKRTQNCTFVLVVVLLVSLMTVWPTSVSHTETQYATTVVSWWSPWLQQCPSILAQSFYRSRGSLSLKLHDNQLHLISQSPSRWSSLSIFQYTAQALFTLSLICYLPGRFRYIGIWGWKGGW